MEMENVEPAMLMLVADVFFWFREKWREARTVILGRGALWRRFCRMIPPFR